MGLSQYNGITVLIDGRIKASAVVDEYVGLLCRELNIHRLKNKLIHIRFVTRLEGMYGCGWGCKKEGVAEIKIARWVEKEKIAYEDMMVTLAHEMVHIKQYFRGELDGSNHRWVWKGRKADGWQYENQPWEREATRLELPLYKKCFPYN